MTTETPASAASPQDGAQSTSTATSTPTTSNAAPISAPTSMFTDAQPQLPVQQVQSPEPAQVSADSASWTTVLPEELKSDPNITKFQSVAELAKGYNNATALIGRDKIPVPQTDEEMRAVQLRLGMPTEPDGYKVGPELGAQWVAEDLQESPEPGVDLPKWQSCFKQLCHEFGFTQNQASKMYERVARETNAMRKREAAKIDAEMAQCEVALKGAWGEAHGLKLQIASKAVSTLFGGDLKAKIDAAGLGRDPQFLQAMADIGSRSLEDLGIDTKGAYVKTPTDLDSEIRALMGHPSYRDRAHPEHTDTLNKVTTLMKRRYPD